MVDYDAKICRAKKAKGRRERMKPKIPLKELERRRKKLWNERFKIIDLIDARKRELSAPWFHYVPQQPWIDQKLKPEAKACIAEILKVNPEELPEEAIVVELFKKLLVPILKTDQRLKALQKHSDELLQRIEEVSQEINEHPETIAERQAILSQQTKREDVYQRFSLKLDEIIERLKKLR